VTTLGVELRVLTSEGPAAVRDRFLDRVSEWRRRRTFGTEQDVGRIVAGLLNVLATPPARRLGGIQIQFLRRLEIEAEQRAYALLHPQGLSYRLERQHGPRRSALELAGPAVTSPLALEDAPFEAAVLRAAEASGASAIHVEGVAGMPPASLLRIARRGLRVILSLHDFALFCPRPDLLEQPGATFCGYCTDLHRCHACLAHHWNVASDFQSRYREISTELLKTACAVIHPSSHLRSKFLELMPGLDPATHRVIAPAPPASVPNPTPDGRSPVRHVAFVGAVRIQKGALGFEEIVRRLGPEARDVRWSILGGGEPDLVRRLRRLPRVSVRGYYRAGSLPRLLRDRRVDVALLLSITPESYGLTLDECQEAGVPVIAFDHGAVAERVRALGGGFLVPLEAGWNGVVTALRDVLDGRRPDARPAAWDLSTRVRDTALAHLGLYRELGLLTSPARGDTSYTSAAASE
jgi:glycosyltransferase involved in cell wall biosynthesis